MDKYRRVAKEKTPQDSIEAHEVRVTSQRSARSYISYSINLFTTEEADKRKTLILIKAMGRAITKAINIAEVVKRRVVGLHQITQIESNTMVDVFEPLEQGLDSKEVTRNVSAITITLSKDPLDAKNPGYQHPLPESMVISEEDAKAQRGHGGEHDDEEGEGRRRPRRGGRGGSSPRGGGGRRGGGRRGGRGGGDHDRREGGGDRDRRDGDRGHRDGDDRRGGDDRRRIGDGEGRGGGRGGRRGGRGGGGRRSDDDFHGGDRRDRRGEGEFRGGRGGGRREEGGRGGGRASFGGRGGGRRGRGGRGADY